MNFQDVANEGFVPLKKRVSSSAEPINLPSKPFMSRGMSFNAETGEKESAQQLWEGSSWERLGRSRGKTMDRANSFVGQGNANKDNNDCVIAIVDPFSTGAHLAAAVVQAGYKCARVLSAWDSPVASLVQVGMENLEFCATVQHNDRSSHQEAALTETANSLRALPFKVHAVLPGAETGVELADQLSFRLGLRTNGIEKSLARRNKYVMGETVRNANVRAVKQARCESVEEVFAFLSTLVDHPGEKNVPCVVKPVQSAGTDDVFLCSTFDEASDAFHRIMGKVNGIGLLNECVLVQEFLVGKEYVVDKVSKDGVHKLVGIWEYDKRRVGNAPFVYFGMRLKPADTEMAKVLVAYADKVLDALQINNGPSHMEVMVKTIENADGTKTYDPCLVEVGARCHGGEGTWLIVAKECVGYTQVEITLDAYINGGKHERIDKDKYTLYKAGREVDIVSRRGGVVRSLPGEAKIKALKSFRRVNWEVNPGDYIPQTIDCFTRPGCVELVADTEEQADKDFEAIHDLEELEMIDYAIVCPKPPFIGAVVVVDPFSTGANIAALVLKWGYKLVLVFSEKDSPVAKLVATGTHVKPTILIQHDNNNPDQDAAIQQTLEAFIDEKFPILAIIPGAETGVELADRLAARHFTRNNGEKYTEVRRNKYLMQEAIRAAGVRAVKQQLVRSEKELLEFLPSVGSPAKTVLKPNESAGTDHVFLCNGTAQAVEAFHAIHGQINGLGKVNHGALAQEFLSGKEFVVDSVSRDGMHKAVAVWEYDKRSVNGANFVYFGMRLRDGNDPDIQALIKYSREVLKALHINQGPSHMEVMLRTIDHGDGNIVYDPCLVEVGSRCHGGEGTWISVAQECIGYNQAEVMLDAYLRPDRFDEVPLFPTLRNHGCEAFLVSHESGHLLDIPGIDLVRSLPSFRRVEMLTQPGARLVPTVDCFSRPGSIQLVSKESSTLEADYSFIRNLEQKGFFHLK